MSGGTVRSGDVVIQYEGNTIALGDDFATNANLGRTPDFGDDVQTVIVHGNQDGTFTTNGHPATASEVSELLQSAPNYNPDSSILLGSCHSGYCSPSVGAEGAQLLSNATGQPVIAPNVQKGVGTMPSGNTNWALGASADVLNPNWTVFIPEL